MSPSTWSWTIIRTLCDDTIQYLPCSPQGEHVVNHALYERSYSIVQYNFDRGCSAQPAPEVLELARSYTQIQCGPNLYTVTFLLSSGQPQLLDNMVKTHHALRNRNGLWCVLPKSQSVVPESWYASNPTPFPSDAISPETSTGTQPNIAEAPVLSRQPKEPSPPKSTQSPNPNYPITNLPTYPISSAQDPVLKHQPTALSPQKSTQSTKSTESTPTFGNEACSEASRSGNGACTEVRRSGNSKAPNPNHPITNLPTYPISSALDELEDLIQDHLVCTGAQRTVLTLWILHTYTCTASLITPYLNISSPIEESGKSTCMTILRAFSANPWWAAGLSPSDFKRKLLAEHPTVLLDNWHTVFRGSDKHPLTGFLLSGCDRTRDIGAGRLDPYGDYVLDNLQTFCPKAFAGSEPLPPSLARRSLPIVLQRRKPQQAVMSAMDLLVPENTHKFTSCMQAWAQDPAHYKQITNALVKCEDERHNLPGFSPHQQDCSRTLIALADTISGHWPEKARAALQEIFREQHEREVTVIHLLSDIRDAFAHHRNPDRIFTAELLDYLHSLDHRTWHEWSNKGDPMTPHALSRLLRKFSVYSRSQRRGEKKLRGYQKSDFVEIWERYLPAPNPHPSRKNQALSQCPTSNKELKTKAIKTNPIVAAKASATADTKADAVSAKAEDKVGKRPSRCRSKDRSQHAARIPRKPRLSSKNKPPRKLPNYQLTQLPNSSNSSIKPPSVSISQFKKPGKNGAEKQLTPKRIFTN